MYATGSCRGHWLAPVLSLKNLPRFASARTYDLVIFSDTPAFSSMETNEELLAKLLRSEKAAYNVAKLRVDELVHATRHELGLTVSQFERLMAGIELGRRISDPVVREDIHITSTEVAIEYCRTKFHRLIHDGKQEEFHIVNLDTKHKPINTYLITKGTLDASLVHPREVFRPAIKDSSSAIILAHNHPSGDPTPSREDYSVTERLTESGKVLGINVLDHIVMGREGCISIRERH